MSRGAPCEPLKSAFRWAKEAHEDDKLKGLLRALGRARGRRNVSARRLALLAVAGLSVRMAGRVCAQEAALFFFFSSEGIGGSAGECVRPGWGRRPLIFF